MSSSGSRLTEGWESMSREKSGRCAAPSQVSSESHHGSRQQHQQRQTWRRRGKGQHLNRKGKTQLQVSTSTSTHKKKTERIQTQYMVPTTVPAPVLATGCRAMHDVGGARRRSPHRTRNPDDCGHQPAAEASESEEQHHPPGPRRRRAGQEVSRGETLHRCVESVRPTAHQAKPRGVREECEMCWRTRERPADEYAPRFPQMCPRCPQMPQFPTHVCIKTHPPPIPPRNHPGCTALLYEDQHIRNATRRSQASKLPLKRLVSNESK